MSLTDLSQAHLNPHPLDGRYADAAQVNTYAPPKLAACAIEVVTTRSRFDALETQWNALFDRAARPDQLFQNFNWLWHWANHFLTGGTKLRIIAGWREGQLVMVWPLVQTYSFGLKKLAWMGEPVSQYGDALVEPHGLAQDMLRQGWAQVHALGVDFVLLRKTRAASSASRVIEDAISCVTAAAPVLDFGQARLFDDVMSRLPGKIRSSRRRLTRRLMEKGDVSFSKTQPPCPETLIREAFNLKRTWLLRRGRYSSAIESDAMLSFFIDIASNGDRHVSMPIDVVYRGTQPIGIGISLSCKGESFGHIIAHDAEFEKQGLGVILSEHILRSCFERGAARFDMLAPKDPYKMEWTDEAPLVHDWILPFTWAGRLYTSISMSDASREAFDRLKNLPPSVGRIVWPLFRGFKTIIKR